MALDPRARAADRRRADHRARRHHAGADPRAYPPPGRRARHRRSVHHARLRRRRRGRRPRRRIAARADRRKRHARRGARPPARCRTRGCCWHRCRASSRRCACRWRVRPCSKLAGSARRGPCVAACGPGARRSSPAPTSTSCSGAARCWDSSANRARASRRWRARIARLIEPTSGAIDLDGTDIARLGVAALRPLRRKLQIVFQDPYRSLDPRRPVGESIIEGPLNYGVDARRRAGAGA